MTPKIHVPDLRARTRAAFKMALEDVLLISQDDDIVHYQYNVDIYRKGIRATGQLVDDDECFTTTPAMEAVRSALLYHSSVIGLNSFWYHENRVLLEEIDTAVINKKETQQ